MKDKKRCFVCLKVAHTSNNCLSKIKCYKCWKCHFEKTDNQNQVYDSSSNTVLLETVITTVENANIQCKVRILFDNGSKSLYNIPLLREDLN